jgi:hypothetical protein
MIIRRGIIVAILVGLLLIVGRSDFRPTLVDQSIAPYKYGLVNWELSHILDKWVHKLIDTLSWNDALSREERISLANEFFTLGLTLRDLELQLPVTVSSAQDGQGESSPNVMGEAIQRIQQQLAMMKADVEETIESEISTVLFEEGLSSRVGIIFPPVDTVFTDVPNVLVVSARDRIERRGTILLKSDILNEEKSELEDLVLREDNLVAIVESIAGVATYPSTVSGKSGLHNALVIAAHEWLHHWFFFRSLGQNFGVSPQMTTLNETAATLGGREIGDRAFKAITGETIQRVLLAENNDSKKSGFNFDFEMRKTRIRTDELLANGRIEEAESYMEMRRQIMVANGFMIRKINQAFFAFRGSYATSPASISPIAEQLTVLRSRSHTLGLFLKTVAEIDSHQEFLNLLVDPDINLMP